MSVEGGDHEHKTSSDLVGAAAWDARWKAVRPRRYKNFNYFHREHDRYLRRFLPVGGRFLELGCAHSLWIPRLTGYHEVWGIDYSPAGLDSLRSQPAVSDAHLVLCDFRDPNNGVPRRYFDVVFSDGLLEHFVDAPEIAAAFAEYVRPGGVVITSVPNMSGAIGALHRLIAIDHYREHVRYSRSSLDEVHRAAGLQVRDPAAYWGHFSLGVVNYERVLRRMPSWLSSAAFVGILIAQQLIAWLLHFAHAPDNSMISPYLRGAYGSGGIPLTSQPDAREGRPG